MARLLRANEVRTVRTIEQQSGYNGIIQLRTVKYKARINLRLLGIARVEPTYVLMPVMSPIAVGRVFTNDVVAYIIDIVRKQVKYISEVSGSVYMNIKRYNILVGTGKSGNMTVSLEDFGSSAGNTPDQQAWLGLLLYELHNPRKKTTSVTTATIRTGLSELYPQHIDLLDLLPVGVFTLSDTSDVVFNRQHDEQ